MRSSAIKNFKKAANEPDEIDLTPKKGVEGEAKKEEEKNKSA